MIELTVNGEPRTLDRPHDHPLLWALREDLGLTGTKYGCGVGKCGSCAVHLDGEPVPACTTTLGECARRSVTTIEALAADPYNPVIRAWIDEQVPQCGFCQPAQVMAAAALLIRDPAPDDTALDATFRHVLCRCGTYPRIHRAALRAADYARDGVPEAVPGTLGIADAPDAGAVLNPWIRIHADSSVTVTIGRSEMGQGAHTGLAMAAAEELEVDLGHVRTEHGPADPTYANPMFGHQTTGGSTSVRGSFDRFRRAGAAAREVLVRAAAAAWGVHVEDCYAEAGHVVHDATGREAAYGDLAARAAALPAPQEPTLKPPERFRLLGTSAPRLDAAELVRGETVYGQDLVRPGMQVAVVLRCPVHGGRLRDYRLNGADQVAGFRQAVALPQGVAVLADDFPAAEAARDGIDADWDPGPNADLDSAAIRRGLEAALERPGEVQAAWGDAAAALPGDAPEAVYHTPFLAHMAMEPLDATAEVAPDGCDVWTGTQAQGDARAAAAEAAGLPEDRVRIHTTGMGGAFGRRLETDFVHEAVTVARAVEAPVKVLWTRADDTRHDFYRPGHAVHLRATLDDAGRLDAWWLRLAGDRMALGGVRMPYAPAHYREERVRENPGVPCGSWRSVEASNNAFAIESFIDELAATTGMDPLDFRLANLAEAPRHRAVVEAAAERAGWGRPVAGTHQGLAVYECFGSIVAEVAEVRLAEDGSLEVPRVSAAIDCGRAINPEGIRAQIEGAVAWALSATLHGAITFAGGATVEATFADEPIVAYPDMPVVEVAIVESDAELGGVGEPGVPPLAPALANAVAAATGRRLRSLPLLDGEGRLRVGAD
ncbi:molybdopterin cofactor-binding domain-containing protein [Thiohalorhabdus sp.]|uniref:molybdopterin cofactor-binding domain-containing protein n=1 Tax=Thiohalorhabdus sp. TaxID=3094134 RepID=UPI002FC3BD1F